MLHHRSIIKISLKYDLSQSVFKVTHCKAHTNTIKAMKLQTQAREPKKNSFRFHLKREKQMIDPLVKLS